MAGTDTSLTTTKLWKTLRFTVFANTPSGVNFLLSVLRSVVCVGAKYYWCVGFGSMHY